MNKPISDKEKLLTMLTEIYDQLEELESVLEVSFSEHRTNLYESELGKITESKQRLVNIETESYKLDTCRNKPELSSNPGQAIKPLKLEIGFY